MTEAIEKTCFKCGETKAITAFHAHKMMKDGRLNKCAACVVKDVAEWRKKTPGCRKKEYWSTRPSDRKTRPQFLEELKRNAKGKKVSAVEYAHRRRLAKREPFMPELDRFVVAEAISLCADREAATGFKWHVDHIVPLHHKTACGLHCASNIQVVPAWWNLKKRNRNFNEYQHSPSTGY